MRYTISRIPALLVVLMCFWGCDSGNLFDHEAHPSLIVPLPPLESIPYDAIGAGKLVFKRNDRTGVATGVYVIDVGKRTSWGFTTDAKYVGFHGGFYGFSGPCVSPDGQKIAFTIFEGPGFGIDPHYLVKIIDIDGQNPRDPSEHSQRSSRSVSWTPDSQSIVSSRGIEETIVRLDRAYSFGHSRVSASADLDLLFPGQRDINDRTINILRQDFGAAESLIWDLAPDSLGVNDMAVAWSPDGTRIAYVGTNARYGGFVSVDGAPELRLWTMDADRGNHRLLLTRKAYGTGRRQGFAGAGGINELSLAWSPDGSRIAFNMQDDSLLSHVFVVGADGSGLTRITTATDAFDTSVSWGR